MVPARAVRLLCSILVAWVIICIPLSSTGATQVPVKAKAQPVAVAPVGRPLNWLMLAFSMPLLVQIVQRRWR